MNYRHSLSLALSISLLIAACAPNTASETATPEHTPETQAQSEGYPALTALEQEGYPGQPTPVDTTLITPIPPVEAPVPAAGLASLSGVLFSRGATVVIDSTFYLTLGRGSDQNLPPEYVADPDPARGDVVGRSDDQGRFTVTDIPPGKYFLFVSGPYGWREAEMGLSDQRPMLVELRADERLALDIVYLTWP